MRNPNRIHKYCQILEECWSKVPDWRFAQLVENYRRFYIMNDPYFMEDEAYFKGLKAYIEEVVKGEK